MAPADARTNHAPVDAADAVGELYEQYHQALFNLVYRLSGDREAARDLMQETFLRALRGYSSFRGHASAKTWIYRIALNVVYERRRRLRARPEMILAGADEQQVETELPGPEDPESGLLRRERQAQVRRALLHLPLKLRTVLVLKEIEGLSYEQIAELTGLRQGTIASRISRARFRLAALLRSS